jgi:hypothetical protein
VLQLGVAAACRVGGRGAHYGAGHAAEPLATVTARVATPGAGRTVMTSRHRARDIRRCWNAPFPAARDRSRRRGADQPTGWRPGPHLVPRPPGHQRNYTGGEERTKQRERVRDPGRAAAHAELAPLHRGVGARRTDPAVVRALARVLRAPEDEILAAIKRAREQASGG